MDKEIDKTVSEEEDDKKYDEDGNIIVAENVKMYIGANISVIKE